MLDYEIFETEVRIVEISTFVSKLFETINWRDVGIQVEWACNITDSAVRAQRYTYINHAADEDNTWM